MPDRTLVVSAGNVMARGFMLVPVDRRSEKGEVVNGLFAVARGVLRALAFKQPARAVAVIDANAPLPHWPPLLAEQLPKLAALCRVLGLPVVEAPDELHVAASYAHAARVAGDDVVVVGVDKRF